MNFSLDAAKLPAGLLLAAALVHFLPAYANGAGLLALAVGAFIVSALKLKGIGALLGMVVAAAIFGALTGIGSPGLDGLADNIPTSTDDLTALTQGAG